MTTLRKALPLLSLCALLLIGLPLAAQTQDCSFTYSFTGDATQNAVSNLSGNTPCVNWRLTFSVTGSLTSTVTFETSPDAGTWTAVPNTVCSATAQPPCVLQGVNPMVGTQGMLYAASYGSYVRVVTSASSGSGTGTIRAYGSKGASATSLPNGGSGGGSGTVTQVATGCGLSGGAITVSGTIIESWFLDPQNGAGAFAIPSTDCGKIVSRNQAGAVSDTIAQAGGAFPAGWHLFYQCMGAGGCTITPATSTINTVASLVLTQGQGVLILSDGTNYTSQGTTAAGGGGSGTVTNTGTLTANAVILGNGGVDVKPGAVLPADATKFYNGAGTFTTPPTASAIPAASNLTPVTVSANTTGDQPLQEIALTAGILNTVNAANLIHGSGILTIAALQTPALTFKALLCTISGCGSGTVVTLATITTAASVSATNNGWNLQLMVGTVSNGNAGTLAVHGAPGLTVDIGALPGSAATLYVDTNTTVTSAIDLSAALFVDFTVATSAGNAGNAFTQSIAESLPWAGAGASSGFVHSRSLTIDHTKCGLADSSSFPVLVSLTDTTFKSASNGGTVQNASGFDIVFAADVGGVTKYPWEVESYDPVNGVLVAWVNVPTVSHTVDTVFYVLYDNAAITSAQNTGPQAPTLVWDSNYVGVWHLGDGTTLSALDSTSNALNGGLVNTPTATAGKIDGAGAFVSASTQYVSLGTSALLQLTGPFTVSAWVNPAVLNNNARILSNLTTTGGYNGYDIYTNNSGGGNTFVGMQIGNAGVIYKQNSAAIPLNAVSYYAGTFDGSVTGVQYVNGAPGAPDSGFPGLGAGSNAYIAAFGVSPTSGNWWGWLDEVRLSKIVRSTAWILTEYNNQFAPGNIGSPNFITYGPQI